MGLVAAADDGGGLGKCPHCRNTVRATPSPTLVSVACSFCGLSYWYVTADKCVFTYNKDAMSALDWEGIQANVPIDGDDSIVLVEKIMYLGSGQN